MHNKDTYKCKFLSSTPVKQKWYLCDIKSPVDTVQHGM